MDQHLTVGREKASTTGREFWFCGSSAFIVQLEHLLEIPRWLWSVVWQALPISQSWEHWLFSPVSNENWLGRAKEGRVQSKTAGVVLTMHETLLLKCIKPSLDTDAAE